MQAGRDVLIELPLAGTLDDARRIIAAQHATCRRAFVDMFSRFSPASRHLREAAAGQRYGPLQVLEIEGPRRATAERATTWAWTRWRWIPRDAPVTNQVFAM